MRHLHQSESQKQTKVTKMISQQVGLRSVNTGQSPAMNTFTIIYSHLISHAANQTYQDHKKKGQQLTKDIGTGRRMLSAMIAVFALSVLTITASLIPPILRSLRRRKSIHYHNSRNREPLIFLQARQSQDSDVSSIEQSTFRQRL